MSAGCAPRTARQEFDPLAAILSVSAEVSRCSESRNVGRRHAITAHQLMRPSVLRARLRIWHRASNNRARESGCRVNNVDFPLFAFLTSALRHPAHPDLTVEMHSQTNSYASGRFLHAMVMRSGPSQLNRPRHTVEVNTVLISLKGALC
jgi:hypothetical protein